MADLTGNIDDLPIVTGGHFIDDATKKILFGPGADGHFLEDYVVRLFTLAPGSESSVHSHQWPHWFLCIKGEGYFLIDDKRATLNFGSWVHIPSGMRHNFGNTGDSELMGLCIVPIEGDVNPLIGC